MEKSKINKEIKDEISERVENIAYFQTELSYIIAQASSILSDLSNLKVDLLLIHVAKSELYLHKNNEKIISKWIELSNEIKTYKEDLRYYFDNSFQKKSQNCKLRSYEETRNRSITIVKHLIRVLSNTKNKKMYMTMKETTRNIMSASNDFLTILNQLNNKEIDNL